MKSLNKTFFFILLPVAVFLLSGATFAYISGWEAPAEAAKVVNPYKGNPSAAEKGKATYKKYCVICHGDKGKGDGMAGMSLNPRPANFASESVQAQTDGTIFWKLTNGRSPMPGYESLLSAEQRWQVVNYLRTFKK